MTTTETSFETITRSYGGQQRLTVVLSDVETTQGEEELLTLGIHKAIQFLVESVYTGPNGSTVIDVQTTDTLSPSSAPACFAYVEAVRGLLQAHTLERGPEASPANLVISWTRQRVSRERTIQYLQSPGGGFSRGATYDLREDIA